MDQHTSFLHQPEYNDYVMSVIMMQHYIESQSGSTTDNDSTFVILNGEDLQLLGNQSTGRGQV